MVIIEMGMKGVLGMGVMSSRCGEHGMNIVMRREVSQVRGVVDDELKVMDMTMGMNRDGVVWARDEHQRGMNVMQPCMGHPFLSMHILEANSSIIGGHTLTLGCQTCKTA